MACPLHRQSSTRCTKPSRTGSERIWWIDSWSSSSGTGRMLFNCCQSCQSAFRGLDRPVRRKTAGIQSMRWSDGLFAMTRLRTDEVWRLKSRMMPDGSWWVEMSQARWFVVRHHASVRTPRSCSMWRRERRMTWRYRSAVNRSMQPTVRMSTRTSEEVWREEGMGRRCRATAMRASGFEDGRGVGEDSRRRDAI